MVAGRASDRLPFRPGRPVSDLCHGCRLRNARRLTHHVKAADAPSWSPDGKKLAISVCTKCDKPSSWWYGGKKVTSVRPDNSEWDIYIINADDSNLLRLTHDRGDAKEPAWSPDGKRITFSSAQPWRKNCTKRDAPNAAVPTSSMKGDVKRHFFFPPPEAEKVSRHPAPGSVRRSSCCDPAWRCSARVRRCSTSEAMQAVRWRRWPTMVLSETRGLRLFSVIRGGIA